MTGITWSTDFTAGCTALCTVLDGSLGGFDNAFVARIADIMSPPDEQCPPRGEGDCEQGNGSGDVNEDDEDNISSGTPKGGTLRGGKIQIRP